MEMINSALCKSLDKDAGRSIAWWFKISISRSVIERFRDSQSRHIWEDLRSRFVTHVNIWTRSYHNSDKSDSCWLINLTSSSSWIG